MKRILFFVLLSLGYIYACKDPQEESLIPYPKGEASGTALIISGAAARISQEIALIERLDELGELKDLALVAGISSGSISAVALNAVANSSNPVSWKNIKDILFSVRNDSIFENKRNALPLDTRRMWHFFDNIFSNKFHISSFKDLRYPTIITCVRFDNRKIANGTNIPGMPSITDNVVEALMATTSIPSVFPSIRINSEYYVDGGINEIWPIYEALQYQALRGKPFKKIILVTFQRNEHTDWKKELSYTNLEGLGLSLFRATLEGVRVSLDKATKVKFIEQLDKFKKNYPRDDEKTVIYIPAIQNPPYFALLDFNSQEEVYDITRKWALSHNPIPLDSFLREL